MDIAPFAPIDRLRALPTEFEMHTQDAVSFAQAAIHAPDDGARLDAAAQSVDQLDHLVTDTEHVPFSKYAFGKEYAAYTLAKDALTAFVATGVVPGARERLGLQDMLAAQQHMHDAIDRITTTNTGVNRAVAGDWMTHAVHDAADALLQLRDVHLAVPLITGLKDVQGQVQHGQLPSADQLAHMDSLFTTGQQSFGEQIRAAVAAAPATPHTEAGSADPSADLISAMQNVTATFGK